MEAIAGCEMDLNTLRAGEDLMQERTPLPYSDAEQQFSQYIHAKMHRILKGDDNRFVLMRRYYGQGCQTGFFMPARIRKMDIRPEVAEAIVWRVLRFLDPFSPGGPIAQTVQDARIAETQTFPTQYPHIVVERTDVFRRSDGECIYIEWRAVRLQNQRRSTAINRALDFGNLAMEVARVMRMPFAG